MSDNIDNIVIEHLKNLRNEIRAFRSETADNFMQVKARLQSLEERVSLTERGLANVHGDQALIQLRLDKIGDRIERVEKRLELTPA